MMAQISANGGDNANQPSLLFFLARLWLTMVTAYNHNALNVVATRDKTMPSQPLRQCGADANVIF